MTDMFTVLSHDHEEVKSMLAQLQARHGVAAAGDAGASERKKMVERLVIEESKHESVEEKFFWPVVRDRVPEGAKMADAATAQEDEGKQLLDKLDKLEPDAPEFEALIGSFAVAGTKHIAYEEHQVWPALRAVLSEQEREEIGRKLEEGKKTAPTRPHPATPSSAGAQKAAAPAALLDKARDAINGRG